MHAMGTTRKRADETAEYRSALLAERARVAGAKSNELEILVLPGSVAMDDQAPLMHDQFVVLRQHRMDRQKLKLIDAALKRLDQGEFGLCTECEEPIPRRRLNIMPWAAYCVPCQDRIDAHGDNGTLDMIA